MVEAPPIEICQDDRGFYWRPESDEDRRSPYYATREETLQAASRWQASERRRLENRSGRTP